MPNHLIATFPWSQLPFSSLSRRCWPLARFISSLWISFRFTVKTSSVGRIQSDIRWALTIASSRCPEPQTSQVRVRFGPCTPTRGTCSKTGVSSGDKSDSSVQRKKKFEWRIETVRVHLRGKSIPRVPLPKTMTCQPRRNSCQKLEWHLPMIR